MKAQVAQEKPVKKKVVIININLMVAIKVVMRRNLIKMSLRMKILYLEEIFKEIL